MVPKLLDTAFIAVESDKRNTERRKWARRDTGNESGSSACAGNGHLAEQLCAGTSTDVRRCHEQAR